MKFYFAVIALAALAASQVPAWGKCGGEGYTGETVCVGGFSCEPVNQKFSQCQPDKRIRFLGRVNPATRELTWPGTGVSFAFTGTRATIGFAAVNGANSVELYVDGMTNPTIVYNVNSPSISTPPGLSRGRHSVVLRKRTDSELGSITIGAITTDGQLTEPDVPTRQIEIIGDSISLGYGLDDTPRSCFNGVISESVSKTCGAVAAISVYADISVIALTGIGVVRNIITAKPQNKPLMPQLYTRYGANDSDNSYNFPASWNPQVVIINLGTNDFTIYPYDSTDQSIRRESINPSTYTVGMVNFARTVRSHYQNAEIFLVSSPILGDDFPKGEAQKTTQNKTLQDAVAQLGPKAHFIEWKTITASEKGCDVHPNAANNIQEAKFLLYNMHTVLGW